MQSNHVRREAQIRVSPKINAYLLGPHLLGTVKERIRDDHLKAPPPKKDKEQPRIRFGQFIEGGVWSNLHTHNKSISSLKSTSPPAYASTSTHNTPTPINLTGPTRNPSTHNDSAGTQDTLDNTVSSLQCSFHQEVEHVNIIRREAAAANA